MCKETGKQVSEPDVLPVLDSYPHRYPSRTGHVASWPLAQYLDESQPYKVQLYYMLCGQKASCGEAPD